MNVQANTHQMAENIVQEMMANIPIGETEHNIVFLSCIFHYYKCGFRGHFKIALRGGYKIDYT